MTQQRNAPPRAAVEMGRFIRGIVRDTLAGRPGANVETIVRCRRRPGGRRCDGLITAHRRAARSPIEWSCPTCGDNGTIDGWSAAPVGQMVRLPGTGPASTTTIQVLFTDEENFEIERVLLLEPEFQRISLDARPVEQGIVFTGSR